jgi:uncharacterized protein with FMN-binding domain
MLIMKKIALSAALILIFAVYVIHQRTDEDEANVTPPVSLTDKQNTSSPTPANTDSANPSDSPAGTPLSTPIPQSGGQFKDGSYDGQVADAFYGDLQVRAVISGGRLTDVQFLTYPNDRRTSIEINQQAMPYLKQEAIKAQNAQVDIVSGATQTSEAFRVTLQSALSQAK